MNKKIKVFAALLIGSGFMTSGIAHAQMAERANPIALDSQFVSVNLNSLANDKSTFDAPSTKIDFNKIPFNIANNSGNNNLFLKNAGWPDWQKDPLNFYSSYDRMPKEPTDAMPVAQIPVDDYSAVYVLASCENDPAFSDILTLRIGIKDYSQQVTYHDYEFTIPRKNEKRGDNVVKVLSSPTGNIFLLRLPINGAFSQEFSDHRALDVEITKKLRLSVAMPDAARFQYMPLGLPSGVHIYGMTFERAPLHFSMQGAQIGNVFNQPQTPSFWLHLEQLDNSRLKNVTVKASAVDYYGNKIEFPSITKVLLPDAHLKLDLPVKRRGYYALTVTVEGDGKVLLEKHTTFALLPKDTRKHRTQSPFGTWDFGGAHYTPNDADVVGPLYVKAGLRYGMFNFLKKEREKYGIIRGNDPSLHLRTYIDKDGNLDLRAGLAKLDEEIAKYKADGYVPQRWLIYHEDSISGNHVTRTPDLFTGKHYQLNADEQKKFDIMWKVAEAATLKIRAAFPHIKIYLGNGSPQLMEEFLRHHYPKNMFDVLGNEAAAFQRIPESQPLDFVANNASLWMERKMLDDYGYKNKPLGQCYEITYPASNPGNMTLSGQANYVIRNVMHSLAWKVPAIRFEGIADPGNSYYFSNWGGTGLMFGKPNLSPKPLYVAVATMTQMLDGATFTRMLPSISNAVYAFEFKRKDGKYVTCIWTPNTDYKIAIVPPGVRGATLSTPRNVTVTDLMGNTKTLTAPDYNTNPEITVSQAPVFVESDAPIWLATRQPVEAGLPNGKYFSISALNDASQWQMKTGDNAELDAYNFMQPRQAGEFLIKNMPIQNAIEVKPVKPNTKNWWIPQYTQLQLKQPVAIDGKPTHIGLLVYGNAGWGRVILELEDAAGQRWISLGAEAKGAPNPWLADWLSKDEFAKLQNSENQSAGISDWNSNDVWGDSVINFAGWNYINIPLPGNYPGEGYHWPRTSQWRCVKADGTRGDYIAHYPLTFKALDITARAKVLYGTEVKSVYRPEIYLKDLIATYGDPDTEFWKPDTGQR
jgi:hypothetical protein